MCIRILMLGNGFDLANKLPTTYKDFLEFCKHASYIFEEETLDQYNEEYDKKYLSKWRFNDSLKQILNKQFHTKQFFASTLRVESDRLNELYDCIHKNTFYEYFQLCLEENRLKGANWIDFESEIAAVIHELEKLIQYKNGKIKDVNPITILDVYDRFEEIEFTQESYDKDLHFVSHRITSTKRTVEQIELEEIYLFISDLLIDLNKLTHALELYLSSFVSRLKPNRITDLDNLCFNHILSSYNRF